MSYSIHMFNYSDYKKQPINIKNKTKHLYQKPVKKMDHHPYFHSLTDNRLEQKDKLIAELKEEIEDLKEQIKLLEAINQEH